MMFGRPDDRSLLSGRLVRSAGILLQSNVAAMFVVALMSIGSLRAQEDSRPGDVNNDGAVDVADARWAAGSLFLGTGGPRCSSTGGIGGVVAILRSLFDTGERLDATDCTLEPDPLPELADFTLDFASIGPISGAAGEIVTFDVVATLTTANNTARQQFGGVPGARAWSISLGAENLRVVAISLEGTASRGVMRANVVDPDLQTGDAPQGQGAVSGVLLSITDSSSLPPEGTEPIAVISFEAEIPIEGISTGSIFYVDGKQGPGRPVPNVVSHQGISHDPALRHDESSPFQIVLNDCNGNDVADSFEIESGETDCDEDGILDECQPDCDGDSISDACELLSDDAVDCNENGIPDSCDVNNGSSTDLNENALPDECETDCNENTVPDDFDISTGDSTDLNENGIPDDCEPDCNQNAVPDDVDISTRDSTDHNKNGVPDDCEPDCNQNEVPDDLDISIGDSTDLNENGFPDDCEDCNQNAIPDDMDLAAGDSTDSDGDGVPDECADCNANGDADFLDTRDGSSTDCNDNRIPDACEPDCNRNGVPDQIEIDTGVVEDCSGNGIPDDCEPDCNGNSVPDDCDEDTDGNGIPDECESEPSFVYKIRGTERVLVGTSVTVAVELHHLGFDPGVAEGASGWSIGLEVRGGRVTAARFPAYLAGANARAEIVDPDDNEGRAGVVSFTVLFPRIASLDPTSSPHDVLIVDLEVLPTDGEECRELHLEFVDTLNGSGQPTRNSAVISNVFDLTPRVEGKTIVFCPEINGGLPPVLTVLGDDSVTLECGTEYEDAGATALGCEGDLTGSVQIESDVDTSVPGSYTVSYSVTARGLDAVATRTVEIIDTTAPELICPENPTVECDGDGGTSVPFDLPLAIDACAATVVCDPAPGSLFLPGVTPVTCTATDAAGNVTVCTFEITVGDCGGRQLPGDCNQDGELDISDGICLLSILFLGRETPCGGDLSGGNVTLLNWKADRDVDLTDGIGIFQHLFLGGPPHALGADCVPIQDCPDVAACDG